MSKPLIPPLSLILNGKIYIGEDMTVECNEPISHSHCASCRCCCDGEVKVRLKHKTARCNRCEKVYKVVNCKKTTDEIKSELETVTI